MNPAPADALSLAMKSPMPIFTEQARCQDCYKCIRACPVKAIQVVDDSAAVMPERCVYCGTCVNVCPVEAKKVRDDLGQAKLLLRRKTKVVASLAPSFVAEFPGLPPGQLIHALRELGFWAVSETALGAEEVSAACAATLTAGGPGAYLSTACPTVVELMRRYHTDQMPSLTRLVSPLMAHCQLLQREYGEDIGIVFIGPCISKKLEADTRPDLLDVALTFAELRRWLEERVIDAAQESATEEDVFMPHGARDGAYYPADGGMTRSITHHGNTEDVRFLTFSGIANLQEAIRGLQGPALKQKVFLELLACEGGCVNGPQSSSGCGTAMKWLQVMDYAQEPLLPLRASGLGLGMVLSAKPVPQVHHDSSAISVALLRLGKVQPQDELNCGGCGYDSCRHLAEALLEGRGEPNMCVSHMRNLAMNKANALIRSMPAGVVLVDERLTIIECNRRFAETLGGDALDVFEAKPGMGGADLRRVVPELSTYFARGLAHPVEALRKDVRIGERILRLTIFTVQPGCIVGGVLQDITEPAVQREQILQRAQEVVRKNVATVQQIAFLLGENAAETEMMLDSLSSSFRSVTAPLGGPAPGHEGSDEEEPRGH